MSILGREAACGWRRPDLVEIFAQTLKMKHTPD
jgi:hypothetical protein